MNVSDRRMQVQLTQEAKIVSDFYFIGTIFAVVGFVSALSPCLDPPRQGLPSSGKKTRALPLPTLAFAPRAPTGAGRALRAASRR